LFVRGFHVFSFVGGFPLRDCRLPGRGDSAVCQVAIFLAFFPEFCAPGICHPGPGVRGETGIRSRSGRHAHPCSSQAMHPDTFGIRFPVPHQRRAPPGANRSSWHPRIIKLTRGPSPRNAPPGACEAPSAPSRGGALCPFAGNPATEPMHPRAHKNTRCPARDAPRPVRRRAYFPARRRAFILRDDRAKRSPEEG
jgi:hypothetical protein